MSPSDLYVAAVSRSTNYQPTQKPITAAQPQNAIHKHRSSFAAKLLPDLILCMWKKEENLKHTC